MKGAKSGCSSHQDILGTVPTRCVSSPCVLYGTKTVLLCAAVVVLEFHYLLPAAAEHGVQLRQFLPRNCCVEEEMLLRSGLLWCSFQRNPWHGVWSERGAPQAAGESFASLEM